MALNIVAALAGVFLVWFALRDVFQSVVVPRAVNRRLRVSSIVVRGGWLLWPRLAYALYTADDDRREELLGTFAPFILIALLVAWVLILIAGYGLILYALRAQLHPGGAGLGDTLYFAGTSLLTIGFGDIVGTSPATRAVALLAGASGLAVVAITTSFLFSMFGAFQRRETFVVLVGSRAGAPPSGIGLLATHAYVDICEDLGRIFREGQTWIAEVMESHLAYPILAYFRSSHDYESWLGTLGTLLDAAVLTMTTITASDLVSGQARMVYSVGRHATHDLAHYFGLLAPGTAGIDRGEFDHACRRLAEAGYTLREREEAWKQFSRLRGTYAAQLNAMARWLEIPPLQWIGDRSLISVEHRRP